MNSLRPSLHEALHRHLSSTHCFAALAAGYLLLQAHASFSWFNHPAPLAGAVVLTVLVAATHQGNWRRVLGSAFSAVAGATLAAIDPGNLPENVFLFALFGWGGFGILAKLRDAKKTAHR